MGNLGGSYLDYRGVDPAQFDQANRQKVIDDGQRSIEEAAHKKKTQELFADPGLQSAMSPQQPQAPVSQQLVEQGAEIQESEDRAAEIGGEAVEHIPESMALPAPEPIAPDKTLNETLRYIPPAMNEAVFASTEDALDFFTAGYYKKVGEVFPDVDEAISTLRGKVTVGHEKNPLTRDISQSALSFAVWYKGLLGMSMKVKQEAIPFTKAVATRGDKLISTLMAEPMSGAVGMPRNTDTLVKSLLDATGLQDEFSYMIMDGNTPEAQERLIAAADNLLALGGVASALGIVSSLVDVAKAILPKVADAGHRLKDPRFYVSPPSGSAGSQRGAVGDLTTDKEINSALRGVPSAAREQVEKKLRSDPNLVDQVREDNKQFFGGKITLDEYRSKYGGDVETKQPVAPITADEGDDVMSFVHYSNEARDVLDPQFQGTGKKGEASEQNRIADPFTPNEVALYRGDITEETVERDISGHTGQKHVVRLNESMLYDGITDPLGLKQKAFVSTGSENVFDHSKFLTLIKDEGYKGWWSPDGDSLTKGQARVFYPVKAEAIEKGVPVVAESVMASDELVSRSGLSTIPSGQLNDIGDQGLSPWLLPDGRVLETPGDHIEFSEAIGLEGYNDVAKETGALRASFVVDPSGKESFVMVQTLEGSPLTPKQMDTVQSFASNNNAQIMFGEATKADDALKVPEFELMSFDDFRARAGVKSEDDLFDQAQATHDVDEHTLNIAREDRVTADRTVLTAGEKQQATKAAKAGGTTAKAVQEEARRVKARFPTADGWRPIQVDKITVKDGKPKVEFKKQAYGFNLDPATGKVNRKTEQKRIEQVSSNMVKEFTKVAELAESGDRNAQVIMRQAGWYKNMRTRLREEFGGTGDLFADLLGALSPNTDVRQNWNFAVQAIQKFSRGDFDKKLADYRDYLDAGGKPSKYPKEKRITQENGKLFGMNSVNGMNAMVDIWRRIEQGSAPKARNFSGNLIGLTNNATIDVWAARMLGRLSGMDRIPTVAEKAVTGNFAAGAQKVGDPVAGEFGFGQSVFREAADQINEQGLTDVPMGPDDLQAVAWFMEKELWGRRGWTTKAGEGGSFEQQADRTGLERLVGGASIQQDAAPTDEAVKAVEQRINDFFGADDSVIAFKSPTTHGLYDGTIERSFDIEATVDSNFKPEGFVGELAQVGKENNQTDVFVSRVLKDTDDNPNARPGLEVFVSESKSQQEMEPLLRFLQDQEIDGFTFSIDKRGQAGATGTDTPAVNGIRIQFVPEIAARWNKDLRERMKDPEQLEQIIDEQLDKFEEVAEKLIDFEGVSLGKVFRYDTVVMGKENYDEYIPGQAAGAAGEAGSRAWFGRPLSDNVSSAIERLERAGE